MNETYAEAAVLARMSYQASLRMQVGVRWRVDVTRSRNNDASPSDGGGGGVDFNVIDGHLEGLGYVTH